MAAHMSGRDLSVAVRGAENGEHAKKDESTPRREAVYQTATDTVYVSRRSGTASDQQYWHPPMLTR